MSSDIAIRVESLSKRYLLRHNVKSEGLRHALQDTISGPFRKIYSALWNDHAKKNSYADQSRPLTPKAEQKTEEFWALKDVCFEIKRGEVVGIIGRNGAGKSTLLKILSRITEPTAGHIEIDGRVASLLEVGTGFHPELTGRENIFLNGAILGMTRKEVRSRFDEIVDFAEVEKFLDTPVKRYSSGMYVRLAFAVAAHLDPEILIVDEVLAVGDAEFQKKCLGRMGEVASGGKTVLFVSHQIAALSRLTQSAILLEGGQVRQIGSTSQVLHAYMASAQGATSPGVDNHRPSWAREFIRSARIRNAKASDHATISMGEGIEVEIEVNTRCEVVRDPVMGVVVNSLAFGTVGGVNTRMTGFDSTSSISGNAIFRCKLESLPLVAGTYTVDVWFGSGMVDLDAILGFLKLDIQPADVYGTGRGPLEGMGCILLKPRWQLEN